MTKQDQHYAWNSPEHRRDYYPSLRNADGRPRNEQARAAATIALYFYSAWRRENEKLSTGDYGHRGEMKNIAAREIIDFLFAWRFDREVQKKLAWDGGPKNLDKFSELVRDLMEKPTERRTPSIHTRIELLASNEGFGVYRQNPTKNT